MWPSVKKKVKKKSTKSHVKVIDYSLTEMQVFLTMKSQDLVIQKSSKSHLQVIKSDDFFLTEMQSFLTMKVML